MWLSEQEAKGQDCRMWQDVVVNLSPTCTGCKVAVSSVCATAHTLALDPHFLSVEGDITQLQKNREIELDEGRLQKACTPNGLNSS